MDNEKLGYLLKKYQLGQLLPDEKQELLKAFSIKDLEADILNWISEEMEKVKPAAGVSVAKADEIYAAIIGQNSQTEETIASGKLLRIRFSWAAAVVLLLMAGGLFLWFKPSKDQNGDAATGLAQSGNDVPAGMDGAILTLADGRTMVLDSMKNGVVADQNGSRVILKNGQLIYDPLSNSTASPAFNKMATPRGRQFKMTLPDGSVVWLNAASSIRYPTTFPDHERLVEIRGEVYFEIAADKKKPFRVKITDSTGIDVLGTSFNISAYENEKNILTTLVQGAVKVRTGQRSQTLKPGQQSIMSRQEKPSDVAINVLKADVNKALAWKNGSFNFNGVHLRDAMKQLERWYDIDVVFVNEVADIVLYGELYRNVSLASVLGVLEAPGVHFKIDGRRLLISHN